MSFDGSASGSRERIKDFAIDEDPKWNRKKTYFDLLGITKLELLLDTKGLIKKVNSNFENIKKQKSGVTKQQAIAYYTLTKSLSYLEAYLDKALSYCIVEKELKIDNMYVKTRDEFICSVYFIKNRTVSKSRRGVIHDTKSDYTGLAVLGYIPAGDPTTDFVMNRMKKNFDSFSKNSFLSGDISKNEYLRMVFDDAIKFEFNISDEMNPDISCMNDGIIFFYNLRDEKIVWEKVVRVGKTIFGT